MEVAVIKRKIFYINLTLSTLIFLLHMFHLLFVYVQLPDEIGRLLSDGVVTAYGPKELIFIIPVGAVLAWILLGFFVKNYKAKYINYINLTEENKERQYRFMYILISSLQFFTFVGLIAVNESFLSSALGESGTIFFTLSLILLLAPIIILMFIYLSWAVKQ